MSRPLQCSELSGVIHTPSPPYAGVCVLIAFGPKNISIAALWDDYLTETLNRARRPGVSVGTLEGHDEPREENRMERPEDSLALRKHAARVLSEVAALRTIGHAPGIPEMRAECRAHLETASWCYRNGLDEWGDLEYEAFIACQRR